MQDEIQKKINETGAKVILKGEVKNIEVIITQYDLCLMASFYEGFSLSVLEAMAMNMPLLLSDIPSFREQCENTAVYFSLTDENDLPKKLLDLSKTSLEQLKAMAENGKQRAIENFTLPQHIKGLRTIYSEALSNGV